MDNRAIEYNNRSANACPSNHSAFLHFPALRVSVTDAVPCHLGVYSHPSTDLITMILKRPHNLPSYLLFCRSSRLIQYGPFAPESLCGGMFTRQGLLAAPPKMCNKR